ncbi:MAG TPA: SEC-C metal-binding domain-containing protein, partial [Terracidiphilus sp.]|nr:SEC-C metal-binding domain-containing protein [Terracidiphilus sp.]
AMLLKFQEDAVRFLFRMQIIGQDGNPVQVMPEPRRAVPAAPPVASAEAPALDAEPREIEMPSHSRATAATIDALEKEFQRKKQRDLAAASRAGAGDASQPQQRIVGDKVGRNDPCPCGSGKKFKKCHGVEK